MLVKILIVLVLIFLILAAVVVIIDRALAAKKYAGEVSDHFDGERFHNIGDGGILPVIEGRPSVLKWLLTREKNEWRHKNVASIIPEERVEGSRVVVTMINHASVLIQTEGLNILTDPTWSGRASPFSFIGPKRFQDPGVRFEDLPTIDVVLVSHNHYDHLNLETLKKLQEKFTPLIITQLGNGTYLADRGIPDAIELDWWDKHPLKNNMVAVSVPAQHFSARSISDRNHTLWGGFVLETSLGNIYFAGDTGYGPFVEKIKEKYPQGFHLGFIPIGAFMPRWFMSQVHTSPDDALLLKDDLSIKTVIPIHFETFRLADDKQDEAEERLREIIQEKNDSSFKILHNGESITVK